MSYRNGKIWRRPVGFFHALTILYSILIGSLIESCLAEFAVISVLHFEALLAEAI